MLVHQQLEAEIAEAELGEFVKLGWPVVEPTAPFVPGWYIDAICEHLAAVAENQLKKLLILVPPRHGKSLLTSVFFPAWAWLRAPSLRFLFASYALSLSVRDSVKCRRLIESAWYQRRWGERFQLVGDQNEKIRYENTKTGVRLATSVEGAATGEGGDIIVCDDPHNIHEAYSATIRQATIEWWTEVMEARVNDPKTGRKVIIMQRVHELDLAGFLLEAGWDVLKLPMEYDLAGRKTKIGFKDPRVKKGALLSPDRFPLPAVDELRQSLGTYAYSAQFQQAPTPPEGGIIKRGWVKFFKVQPDTSQFELILQSWDLAFKDLAESSYVVGQVWGKKGAEKYLLDQVRAHLDFPATISAIKTLSGKWPTASKKLVEDKANGPAVIQSLKKDIAGLIESTPEGSKESRLYAVSPEFEAGNIFVPEPKGAPWVHDYIEELTGFPKAAHDDQVDGTTQALLHFRKLELTQSAFGFSGSIKHPIIGGSLIRTLPRRQREASYKGLDPREA